MASLRSISFVVIPALAAAIVDTASPRGSETAALAVEPTGNILAAPSLPTAESAAQFSHKAGEEKVAPAPAPVPGAYAPSGAYIPPAPASAPAVGQSPYSAYGPSYLPSPTPALGSAPVGAGPASVPGKTCEIPMWGANEYVCDERTTVEKQNVWKDSKGNRRKKAAEGAICNVACPAAKSYPPWLAQYYNWMAPTVDMMTCEDGAWVTAKTHTAVSSIQCTTSNYTYGYFLILTLAAIFAYYRYNGLPVPIYDSWMGHSPAAASPSPNAAQAAPPAAEATAATTEGAAASH